MEDGGAVALVRNCVQFIPEIKRTLEEGNVVGVLVVTGAKESREAGGTAEGVHDVELFESESVNAASGEVIKRGGADDSESCDDDVKVVVVHGLRSLVSQAIISD